MTRSAEHLPGKAALIRKVLDILPKLQEKFQAEDDEEKEWMIRNCGNPEIVRFLEESTMSMLHVVDAVGQLEPVNGTTISKRFGFPKGSVSKLTRRLVQLNVLDTEQLADNKKEVLYRTTPLGKDIFKLHRALHERINVGVIRFLQRYDEQQLQFLVRGLEDTMEASWVGGEDDDRDPQPAQAGNGGAASTPAAGADRNRELEQIGDMLARLDSRSLSKAKAILQVVFFSPDEP